LPGVTQQEACGHDQHDDEQDGYDHPWREGGMLVEDVVEDTMEGPRAETLERERG